MDQFAQSREDDDLFGDDFEPVPTPTVTVVEDDLRKIATPKSDRDGFKGREGGPAQDRSRVGGNEASREQRGRGARGQGAHRGRGQDRGRGRGGQGGAGQAGQTGLAGSRYAPAAPAKNNVTASKPNAPATTTPPPLDSTANDTTTTDRANTTNRDEKTPSPKAKAAAPRPQTPTTNTEQPERPQKATAVRGDRSLTGGPSHKKLSEAELSEKMARMAILNAEKAEKFRAAEADSAAFQQKEAEMRKKRAEEQKNAREMDKERAKNRERKLKAQGGREWDSEKVDADVVDGRGRGRSSQFVRGGHGGVIRAGGLGGSRFADVGTGGDDVGYQIRGRGGVAQGRGRGRGRGERGGKASPPAVPTTDDFPSLPPPVRSPAKAPLPEEPIKSPTEPSGRDWAEEMATPVEEKKMSV